jgi:hypothetical protein
MSDDTGRVISPSELGRLAELYLRFEGSPDPLSVACKEAKQEFDLLVERIYTEKVASNNQSISLIKFRSYARVYCRKIWAKQWPNYPCIGPERMQIADETGAVAQDDDNA